MQPADWLVALVAGFIGVAWFEVYKAFSGPSKREGVCSAGMRPAWTRGVCRVPVGAGGRLSSGGEEDDGLLRTNEARGQLPRLYRDLAEWYPLLTPVADYAEEAAFYRRLFGATAGDRLQPARPGQRRWPQRRPSQVDLSCTLVDLSPAMLAREPSPQPGVRARRGRHALDQARPRLRLRPGARCRQLHVVARRSRRGHQLRPSRTRPPAAWPCSSRTSSWRPSSRAPRPAAAMRGVARLRYLEWRWDPDPRDEHLRDRHGVPASDESGAVEVLHDRHVMGLFARARLARADRRRRLRTARGPLRAQLELRHRARGVSGPAADPGEGG